MRSYLTRRSATRALRARVAAVPFWYHSIELGNGVVTPGVKTRAGMDAHVDALALPDLRGKTVLDIGAWDGYFSFDAERRGASRVVALDHFVWEARLGPGGVPSPDDPAGWDRQGLPGKAGFDLAHEVLGSSVEARVGDFMEIDLAELGRFDVVIFSGVLYHLEEPLRALRRLSALTAELAIIETAAVHVGEHPKAALVEFYPGAELNDDAGNWWAPSANALVGMCAAAGFAHTDVIWTGLPDPSPTSGVVRHRIVVHAQQASG
jgi:tRNA (mo5U34)-methyltransferase